MLPSIFVVGPVLMLEEYDGARSWALVTALFGLGNILGDVLLLQLASVATPSGSAR